MLSTLICVVGLGQVVNDPILDLELEMERREWIPPETSLPKEFVETARFMFKHGLADPSGGELSYVRIDRDVTSQQILRFGENREEDEVRVGWVIDFDHIREPIFVGLDGLLYIAKERIGKAPNSAILSSNSNFLLGNQVKGLTVVALLLRAGDVEASEGLFKFLMSEYETEKSGAGNVLQKSWIHYATSVRMSRGIDAFMRGLDEEAFRQFDAVSRNSEVWRSILLSGRTIEETGYDPLRRASQSIGLVNDTSRRIESHRSPFDEEFLGSLSRVEAIDYCIQYLDESRLAGYWMTSSRSEGDNVPLVRLVEFGDDAVPSLLHVAESDNRYVRETYYPFSRRHGDVLQVVQVKRIALEALEVLMFGLLVGTPDEKLDQAKAFWSKYKSEPPTDRLYLFLQDEEVSVERKLRASKWVSGYATRYNSIGEFETFDFLEDKGTTVFVDILRQKSNPSFTEVLQKLVALEAQKPGGGLSAEFAQHLFKWSASDALPSLTLASDSVAVTSDQHMANLARLACARDFLGDPDAFKEYAEALVSYKPRNGRRYEIIAPIALYAGNPYIEEIAGTVFKDSENAWHPQNLHLPLHGHELRSHLLSVPEFQDAVLEILNDKEEIGVLHWVGQQVWIAPASEYEYRRPVGIKLDVLADPDNSKQEVTLRNSDSMAYVLSQLQGAPRFSPLWPKVKRDATIPRIRDFVIRMSASIDSIVSVHDVGRLPDYYKRG